MLKQLMAVIPIILVVQGSSLWGQTVTCVGTESGGNGQSSCGTILRYAYEVNPQAGPMAILMIGTEDPNQYMHAGWMGFLYQQPARFGANAACIY
jgi:hypothetical protein